MSVSPARRAAGAAVSGLGLLYASSGVVVNPWTARALLGGRGIDYADVALSYFLWSLGLGLVVVLLGRIVASGRAARLDGPILLLVMLASLVLLDRLVLAGLGKPLWMYDQALGYRNRPDKVVSLHAHGRPDETVRINRHGHHDDDFPVEKPANEFRVLVLGDSVAMGDGVPYRETFSAQLEELLAKETSRHASYQVINTGVHGYSAFQELRILEESLRFAPNVVVLGFCMNDVTEPFVANEEFGGVGLDYHGVQQTPNPLLGYLLNETGAGRLLQRLRLRSASRDAAKLEELYGVKAMAREGRANPRFDEAWRIVLRDLDRIHDVVAKQRLPFVLLVFPFTFQLVEHDARDPQRILREWAASRAVPLIDFTEIFEKSVLAAGERSSERMREYFRDDDHFAAAGHAVVADALLELLRRERLLE